MTAADPDAAPRTRADGRLVALAHWVVPAAVYLMLCGVTVGRKPLFRDETATYLFSRLSPVHLVQATRHVDGAFLPYYLLAHLTPGATAHPVLLRSWSVLAGTGTVAVVAVVAGLLWNRWTGLVAGLVLCGNSAFLMASDTARPAALSAFFCALATLVLVRARDRTPTTRALAWYAVSVALAGLLTAFSLLILGAHLVIAVAWFVREHRRRLAAFAVAAGVGTACVLPLVVSAQGQRAQIGWITARSASAGLHLLQFQSGYVHHPRVLVAALLVILIGCAIAPRTAAQHIVGIAVVAVPTVGLWAASQVIQPLEIARYLVSVPMGTALAVAGAIHVLAGGALTLATRGRAPARAALGPNGRRPPAPIVAVAVVVALGGLAVSCYAQVPQLRPRFTRASLDHFPSTVDNLERALRPGDHVIFTQNYASQGRVAGIALYAGDSDLLRTLSAEAPHGAPLLLNRVVVSNRPLRTRQATTPRGAVWVLGGRPRTTDNPALWSTRLLDEGCSPSAGPVPERLRHVAARWTCRRPIDDATSLTLDPRIKHHS